MEDNRRDGEDLPPSSSLATTELLPSEPAQPRRRGGAQKRKANPLSASTPLKRFAREKAFISNSLIQNGPLTRGRQGPNNFSSADFVSSGVKNEVKPTAIAEAATVENERIAATLEALEAQIETEFETIRSRDANSHVVPSHCGWFSWTEIHYLEKQALPTFFDGKSETRTPDIYLEIRNWIVKRFHSCPFVQMELKDLSALEVGNLEARQEVMEFLDYWGLINFHPFPPKDSLIDSSNHDKIVKQDSVLDNLYHFEAIESCLPMVRKAHIKTPTTLSGVLSNSSIAEELVRPEGPAVEMLEYHCNSCSADCSQKRYHCQTQADYDLCTDCFKNGKFGSVKSSSDFILMVPAEAPGVTSGTWTDQEILLLLEALELYKENWNEIAEHVGTKTKAQCILHFVQMPIEDRFLDREDDEDANPKEITYSAASIDHSSDPKDTNETDHEGKIRAIEDQHSTCPMEESKPQDMCETKAFQETLKTKDVSETKVSQEISNSDGIEKVKAAHKTGEEIMMGALMEAFEAVSYNPTLGKPLSFSEAGNPVTALVAFLSRLAGSDLANASARTCLRNIWGSSPGLQLAARHCYVLEHPPSDEEKCAGSESDVTKIVDRQSEIDHDEQINDQETENSISSLSIRDFSNNRETLHAKNEQGCGEVEEENFDELRNSKLAKDLPTSVANESVDLVAKSEFQLSSVTGCENETKLVKHSQPSESEVKDVQVSSDSLPSAKNLSSQPAESLKDVDQTSDSPPSKNNNQPSVPSDADHETCQTLETQKDANMVSDSLPLEEKEHLHLVTSNAVAENEVIAGKDHTKDCTNEKPGYTETIKMQDIAKLKRVAASAISAAAVKAKVLAEQEEEEIQQLVASVIDKQLRKLESKLAFFNEMDNVVIRGREQLERSRQKLYHERAQIVASRLGLLASSSRAGPPPSSLLPANRMAMNFPNPIPRPAGMMMNSQLRAPFSRPMENPNPISTSFVASLPVEGSIVQTSLQDRIPSSSR